MTSASGKLDDNITSWADEVEADEASRPAEAAAGPTHAPQEQRAHAGRPGPYAGVVTRIPATWAPEDVARLFDGLMFGKVWLEHQHGPVADFIIDFQEERDLAIAVNQPPQYQGLVFPVHPFHPGRGGREAMGRAGSFGQRPGGFRDSAPHDQGPWGHRGFEARNGPSNQPRAPPGRPGPGMALLGQRSMPVEPSAATAHLAPALSMPPADGPSRPKANPFGAAKPVDTASKLKEIEEKAVQMRREAEEAAKREAEERRRHEHEAELAHQRAAKEAATARAAQDAAAAKAAQEAAAARAKVAEEAEARQREELARKAAAVAHAQQQAAAAAAQQPAAIALQKAVHEIAAANPQALSFGDIGPDYQPTLAVTGAGAADKLDEAVAAEEGGHAAHYEGGRGRGRGRGRGGRGGRYGERRHVEDTHHPHGYGHGQHAPPGTRADNSAHWTDHEPLSDRGRGRGGRGRGGRGAGRHSQHIDAHTAEGEGGDGVQQVAAGVHAPHAGRGRGRGRGGRGEPRHAQLHAEDAAAAAAAPVGADSSSVPSQQDSNTTPSSLEPHHYEHGGRRGGRGGRGMGRGDFGRGRGRGRGHHYSDIPVGDAAPAGAAATQALSDLPVTRLDTSASERTGETGEAVGHRDHSRHGERGGRGHRGRGRGRGARGGEGQASGEGPQGAAVGADNGGHEHPPSRSPGERKAAHNKPEGGEGQKGKPEHAADSKAGGKEVPKAAGKGKEDAAPKAAAPAPASNETKAQVLYKKLGGRDREPKGASLHNAFALLSEAND